MDEAILPDIQGQPDPFAVVRVGIQPGQLSAAAGAAQEYSAVVVDDASGEVGKDRGEGDSALEVRDVPTGGGRRAATTVRSDSGADRTACDSTRGVSIRLRSPVGQNTKRFLARATGNAWPSGGKPRPNQLCGGASSIRMA